MLDTKDDNNTLTPDEVIAEIKKMGITKISRRTLLRWEKEGLIPSARRGSHGRGIGYYTEYPYNTPVEFYASYNLIYSQSAEKEDVAKVRKLIDNDRLDDLDVTVETENLDYFSKTELMHLAGAWLNLCSAGLDIQTQISKNSSLEEAFLSLKKENEGLKAGIEKLKAEIKALKKE